MTDRTNPRGLLFLRNPVCLSLDLSNREKGLSILESIGRKVGMVKAGPVPFLSYGSDLLREAERLGILVFLDLKWHDIPNTVQETILNLPSPAVRMVTIHAQGGPSMIKAARKACDSFGGQRPLLVAVTALTHLTDNELHQVGLPERNQAVRFLGSMALESGADGLVLSPHELSMARTIWGAEPILVTPGIRHKNELVEGDDQANTSSPETAIALGSDLLVIGRPILAASDPSKALQTILSEIPRSGL